jgi:hypothetical protein
MGWTSWSQKSGVLGSPPYEFEPTSEQDLLDVAKMLIAADDVGPWLNVRGMHERLTEIDEGAIESRLYFYGVARKWGARDTPLFDISVALARKLLTENQVIVKDLDGSEVEFSIEQEFKVHVVELNDDKALKFISDRIYHRKRSDSAMTQGNNATLAECVLYAKYKWNDPLTNKAMHGDDDWPENAAQPRPPISDKRRSEIGDNAEFHFRRQYGLHRRRDFGWGIQIAKDFQFGKIKSLDDTSLVIGRSNLRDGEF